MKYVRMIPGLLGFISLVLIMTPCFSQQYHLEVFSDQDTVVLGDSVFIDCYSDSVIFSNDFNLSNLGVGWGSANPLPDFNNVCGLGPNGVYAWFGDQIVSRRLETVRMNLTQGTYVVDFQMRYGSGAAMSGCAGPNNVAAGVHLQTSTNWGATWIDFSTVNINPSGPNSNIAPFITDVPGSGGYWTPVPYANQALNSLYYWHRYRCEIPSAANTSNTQFRWAQLYNTTNDADEWGLDEVKFLKIDTAGTYEWKDPNGVVISNNKTLGYTVPQVSGYYTLSVIYQYSGSAMSDSVYIHVLSPSSLNSIFQKSERLFISPNPSSGIFKVSTNAILKELIIYNVSGTRCYYELLEGEDLSEASVSTVGLKQGIYLLVAITKENYRLNSKLMIY